MKLRISPMQLALSALWIVSVPPVFAAESRPPQWYEIATGIIAIPAALIGLAYSYLLIKKTRLEARKTELEILEKERQLAQIATGTVSEAVAITVPSGEGRIALLLLLRFVVLWLIASGWGLIEDAFDLVFTSAIISAQQLLGLSLSGWAVIPLVAIQKLPKVAYWIVFVALAWPLFKDTNAALGIDIKDFLRVSLRKDRRSLEQPANNTVEGDAREDAARPSP
jgi:hypothetical protein